MGFLFLSFTIIFIEPDVDTKASHKTSFNPEKNAIRPTLLCIHT